MNLKELQNNWNALGEEDPLWAILTEPEKKGNKWQLAEFFELGRKEIHRAIEQVNALGIHVNRGRALDFGSGVGRLTQSLADYFDEVWGVDIAFSMINLARKYNRHDERCKYYVNETDDLNIFSTNSFDFIYTNIVLQHMSPSYAKSYIREFLRVLKPKGVLMFQLPTERIGLLQELKHLIKLLTPYPVLRWYAGGPYMEMNCVRKDKVVSLLTQNGGKILDIAEERRGKIVSLRYCVTKEAPQHPDETV